jgi:copper chaperone
MRPLHIAIVGMTCEHCVRAVRNRLAFTPGIEVTDVQIGAADINYDPSKVLMSDIEDAISDEGYTVDSLSERAS